MKTAFVTGSAGFIGRHMTAELRARGWGVFTCDVANVVNPDSPAARAHDALHAFRVLERRRFDLVVHCAARAPHRAAIDGQPATMTYNAMLDAAMFDWAVRTRQHRVLYLSSSAVYPVLLQADVTDRHRLCEDDQRLGFPTIGAPDAGYGWTKLYGERMAAAAAEAGLAVHVVRPFSGYGEDQGVDWPFGAFADRARRREDPFLIWGSGDQRRDFIHVDDVVAGALAVVDADVREPVNLCTGRATRMYDLAKMICRQAGYMPTLVIDPDRPEGVEYRVGDPSRLHGVYRPRVSLDEGVARAVRQAVAS